MINADKARMIVRDGLVFFDRDQIEANIESTIVEAAKHGHYSVEYFVNGRDWLLKEHPKTFKKNLNVDGFSVSLLYDEDMRAGMKTLKSLRISWSKQ